MGKLTKSTISFAAVTFLSWILGFMRDMVAALMFGASGGYDAFIIAFKIPNFLRRMFAEGAFSQAFVPVLSEYKNKNSEAEVKVFLDHVLGNLTAVVAAMTILGIIAAPWVIQIFAPGFIDEAGRFELAVRLLRITFGYILCISLTALAGGILNTYDRFALPAFTPILLNLSMILATWYLAPQMAVPIEGLAFGVLLGGILQLLFQIPLLVKLRLLPRWRYGWRDPGVKRIVFLMLPALFAASILQINSMIDSIFASFLPVGSVSWLYYSERLLEFPLGVFGVAIATVVLPHLSQKYVTKSEQAFSAAIDWALRWVILVGLPATIGLWMLSSEIVCTLFQYGQFSAVDMQMTALGVANFSLGIMSFIGTKVLTSAYYARQEMGFPVKVALATLIVNTLGNMVLMGPLAHAGLALASVLAAWVNWLWLGIRLYRHRIYRPLPGWLNLLGRAVLGSLLMLYVLNRLSPEISTWLQWSAYERLVALVGLVIVAVLTYTLGLLGLGLRSKHVALRHA